MRPAPKKRIRDMNRLLDKIYEDNTLGKLSDERYNEMDAKYS